MFYPKILDKLNKVRLDFGLTPLKDLPKGRREASNSCPIAVALKEIDEEVEVNPDNIQFHELPMKDRQKIANIFGDSEWNEYRNFVALDQEFMNFIQEFDEGWIPEYDINIKDTSND